MASDDTDENIPLCFFFNFFLCTAFLGLLFFWWNGLGDMRGKQQLFSNPNSMHLPHGGPSLLHPLCALRQFPQDPRTNAMFHNFTPCRVFSRIVVETQIGSFL